MRRFCEEFEMTSGREVLDVGGTPVIWSYSPVQPHVTFVNLRPPRAQGVNGSRFVLADGRHLPFKDKSFDLVFSNSLIEHLGSRVAQQEIASEIDRVGKAYYVQTPYRWFPVEPHLMTPFIHFLPRRWQLALLRNFTVRGLMNRPSRQWCADFMRRIRLLDLRDVAELFPGSKVSRERILGLTKSLLVTRQPRAIQPPEAPTARPRQRAS